jgi:hypothetical protein
MKVAQDFSLVRQVGLSSFYQRDSYVCHEGVAHEFMCNWDERTFSSRVNGQEFTLTREVLLWIFLFKDGIAIVSLEDERYEGPEPLVPFQFIFSKSDWGRLQNLMRP